MKITSGEFLLPNGDMDKLTAGIPPKNIYSNDRGEKKFYFNLLETAFSIVSLLILLNCCEIDVIICPTIF